MSAPAIHTTARPGDIVVVQIDRGITARMLVHGVPVPWPSISDAGQATLIASPAGGPADDLFIVPVADLVSVEAPEAAQ